MDPTSRTRIYEGEGRNTLYIKIIIGRLVFRFFFKILIYSSKCNCKELNPRIKPHKVGPDIMGSRLFVSSIDKVFDV